MSSQLKLVFVPVWLEKTLEAYGERLATAVEPEKLNRILSTADITLYSLSQCVLQFHLPYEIAESFKDPAPKILGELDEEQKRGYVYGFLPDTDELPVQPKFCAHHVGYDYVIVTVDKDQSVRDPANIIVMEAIIEILRSVQPLEDVAKLPIMQAWLKATTKNSVL